MFDHGAEIVRVDFHMHTLKDKEFMYSDESNSFINAYVNEMQRKNVRITGLLAKEELE